MKRKIVCVGNLVHDEVFRVPTLPVSGIKVGVIDYEERFGGPAATAAVAICRLGGEASYWGRVGQDEAGEKAVALMTGFGVDCAGVAMIAGRKTLRAMVMVDDEGERAIVSDRRSLPTDAEMLTDDPMDDAAVLLADTRWPAGAEKALARARAKGIPTVLDADGGRMEDNLRLIALTDHVVFSSEGLREFAGSRDGDPEMLLRRAATDPSKIYAVTRGSAGSLWMIDGAIIAVPAFKVAVIDTTGCGDVFHGAYAMGLGEGLAPVEAARLAGAVAALKAQEGRGWDGMPDRAAVNALMARG